MSSEIIHGDCLDVLPTLAVDSFDSIVTDPPYGLSFMGKDWDHGVPGEHFWREALRVAKPGAHLVAFGGTRTHHRLMCAIEDAGWEIRDTLGWLFGSGFPKSRNGAWGGTALKPAWEPIILARKPLRGTVAQNVERYGTGGLNIDGCRIDGEPTHGSGASMGGMFGMADKRIGVPNEINSRGRWPANIAHDGSEEVLAVFPETESGSLTPEQQLRGGFAGVNPNCYGTAKRGGLGTYEGSSGSAARFFYCSKAGRADRNDGCYTFGKKPLNWSSGEQSPGTFQAENTDRSAHNHHPTVKPTELMRWLVRLVTPRGGLILDPFCGSGSTGRAALLEGMNFVGIERDAEYAEVARARIYASAPLFA